MMYGLYTLLIMGDNDHPATPIHVRLARGGASGRDGVRDMPSSWHGGSVGVSYLHLRVDE